MNTNPVRISTLVVSLYAWLVTIYFGFVLMDRVYASLVPGERAATLASAAVADLLLLGLFVIVIAGLGAAAFSWKNRAALVLMIASLAALGLELLIPALLPRLLGDVQNLSWLRMLPAGGASILAFTGLYQLTA